MPIFELSLSYVLKVKFGDPRLRGSKVIDNSDGQADRQTIFIKYLLPLLKINVYY
jgi:hypothetical protein